MARRIWGGVLAATFVARTAIAAPETAKAADDFVESVGVNVHLGYDGTPYVDGFDSIVVPRLAELGVRHVRDGALTGPSASADLPYYGRVRALAARGIRFSLITAMDTEHGQATDYAQLPDVFAWSDGAVDDFEGINEPDLQTIPGHAEADAWVQITQTAQHTLFDAVHGAPALAGVSVLGPSITSLNGALERAGDLGAWVDYGNGHPYPGGFCPACGTFYGQSVDTWAPAEAAVFASKPMVMTETGYHNALNAPANGHRPADELAAGKYMPRLLFELFNRGVVRTYSYELVDQADEPALADPERHFGLLRHDGSPKPAFTAESSVLQLLADPGSPFAPAPLDWQLEAPPQVHHTVLQKRDGRWFVALWQEVASWDTGWNPADGSNTPANHHDIAVPKVSVTATIASAHDFGILHALADDGSLQTTMLPAAAAFTFDVGDAVVLLEIGSSAAPAAADGGSVVRVPPDAGLGSGSGGSDFDPGFSSTNDGGCGCRAAHPTAGPAAGLLGLAVLVASRRRRLRS